MKASAVPLLDLFEKKLRLEVPLFQRQYVWSREQQWEPLWEDIARKFEEALLDRKDAPVHFLGALVLDLKQTPATHVEKRQVIDGQQRLTTFQIFLSALRDFCREHGCEEMGNEFGVYTQNTGKMADPEVDRFKVWPTQADRGQFADVVGLGSRAAVEAKHPPTKKNKRAKKWDPRPRMVEAYLFFGDEIREFFLGTGQEPPLEVGRPLAERLDACFQALKSTLQVVEIDLESGDDAQVIFETLNARGEPLLPADLLRNYIFLRAARSNEPQEKLYHTYWGAFDDEFWRAEVPQGRLTRPRSDLFLQHFLASRQMIDTPIKHLFVEYRTWIERHKPFKNVTAELAALAKQRDEFRRLMEPHAGDAVHGLAKFLNDFDIGTAYPLLLFLFDAGLSPADWGAVSVALESYLLRRAVVGWSTKAYNKTLLNAAKALRDAGPTPQALVAHLSRLQGENVAWPTDAAFAEAWRARPAYEVLNNAKLVHILWRLDAAYRTKFHEQITLDQPLTIEHIMPQSWVENWPLASGEAGFTDQELWVLDEDGPRAADSRRRHAAVQRMGNLTIIRQELNSSVSNSAWATKKPALLNASLLPINQQLVGYEVWDETAIEKRGEELLQRALTVWPGPVAPAVV